MRKIRKAAAAILAAVDKLKYNSIPMRLKSK